MSIELQTQLKLFFVMGSWRCDCLRRISAGVRVRSLIPMKLYLWPKYLAYLCMALCSVLPAFSVASPAEVVPAKVTAGIYVNQIYAINLKENKLSVDFYVWFRYSDDSINPLDSFELVNGRIESKSGIVKKKIKGTNYTACRVVATINKFWDVSKYPLDQHVLSIELEDSENDDTRVVFLSDSENAGINPDAQVRGWLIARVRSGVTTKSYETNYGDISLPINNRSSFSRYTFDTEVIRPGYGQFFKLFALMFLAVFVAFLAFFVQPSAGPRFGLGTGALFAAAANSFVVGSSLPESNGPTLADQLQIMTIVFIFVSLAISTLSLRLVNSNNELTSKRVDRIASVILPLLYVALSLWLVMRN